MARTFKSMRGRRFVVMAGQVHMVCPIGGAEHTLCGVANDAADSERDESLRWHPTGLFIVECTYCTLAIEACRGVLTRAEFQAHGVTKP